MDIKRLRALEKEIRAECPSYCGPDVTYQVDAAAVWAIADKLAGIIAELGQEVGAVAWQWRWLGDSDEGPGHWNLCDNEAHSKLVAAKSGYEVRALYFFPAHTSESRDSERLNFLISIADVGGRITKTSCGEYRISGDWATERRNARESIDAAMRQEGGE